LRPDRRPGRRRRPALADAGRRPRPPEAQAGVGGLRPCAASTAAAAVSRVASLVRGPGLHAHPPSRRPAGPRLGRGGGLQALVDLAGASAGAVVSTLPASHGASSGVTVAYPAARRAASLPASRWPSPSAWDIRT